MKRTHTKLITKLLCLVLLVSHLSVLAQAQISTPVRVRYLSTLPVTCSPETSAMVRLTNAPYTLYNCTATDTWTEVGAGAASAPAPVASRITTLGLEESSPYDGATLSNLSVAGQSLTLGRVHQLNSANGLTLASGTAPTYEFDRARFTAAGETTWNTALGAGFDLRVEYDLTTVPQDNSLTGDTVLLSARIDANNHVEVLRSTGFRMVVTQAGVVRSTSTIEAASPRLGRLRLLRAGNVFTASYWSWELDAWVSIGTYTQAYTGTFSARVGSRSAGVKFHMRGLQDALAVSATGSYISAVFEATGGLRGVDYASLAGGTGATVLVDYRRAATVAGVAGASWLTLATDGSTTIDATLPYVQVRATLSATVGVASPTVGAFMARCTLSRETADLLFRRGLAALHRHTDANNRLAINEAAFNPTMPGGLTSALIARTGFGYGRWLAQGNSPFVTIDGTSFDSAATFIAGADRLVQDYDYDNGMQVEASFLLQALYHGRSVLLPRMTGAQKSDWTTKLTRSIGVAVGAVNYNAFIMHEKRLLTLLSTYDPGYWRTYTDASLDSHFAAIQAAGYSNGSWNDSITAEHRDAYSSAFPIWYANILEVHPNYGNAATMREQSREHAREMAPSVSQDGLPFYYGRSIHAGIWVQYAQTLVPLSRDSEIFRPKAREAISTGVNSLFAKTMLHGFDVFAPLLDRRSNSAGAEAYTTHSLLTPQIYGTIGDAAATSEVWEAPAAEVSYPASVNVWQGQGVVSVRGARTGAPLVTLHAKSWDATLTTPLLYGSRYAGRVVSPRFGQNVGAYLSTPSPQNGFWIFRDNALSTNNLCSLQEASSAFTWHLGRAGATWRTGLARQFSATVAGTATTTPMTDIALALDNHIIVVSKIELGARTASLVTLYTPPIPMPPATGLAVQTTDAAAYWSYGERQIESVLSTFVRSLTPTTIPTVESSISHAPNNRLWNVGRSGRISTTVSKTGTIYPAADIALLHGQMVPATEASYVTNYSQVGDVVTFDANTVDTAWVAFTGQTNPTHGNWSLTGTDVRAFSGRKTATDYFGAANVTQVSYSGAAQLLASVAANIAAEKVGTTQVKLWTSGGGSLTMKAAMMASATTVLAYDRDGLQVDITSQCTFSAGDVTIPSGVVASYTYGMARFLVTQ